TITTANLTVNGGTLDMQGHAIGATTVANSKLIDTLAWSNGTLKNISDINTGAGLNKSTGALFALEGTHTYTGPTILSQGTLQADGTLTGAVTIGAGAGLNPGTRAAPGTLTLTAPSPA